MKPKFFVRQGAQRDIELIDEYLAQNASDEVAADFVETLTELFRLLASQPMMGRALLPLRTDLESVRIWPFQLHRGYLVFYTPLPKERGVEILHVFDAARDIVRLIDEEF